MEVFPIEERLISILGIETTLLDLFSLFWLRLCLLFDFLFLTLLLDRLDHASALSLFFFSLRVFD